jgi:hypothetical protein
MYIEKCDICHKEMSDENRIVRISYPNYFNHSDLCDTCGKPIVKFLMKNKLMEAEKL